MSEPQSSRPEPSWSLLHIVAIVTGAAVASMHLKDRAVFGDELNEFGVALLIVVFLFLAVAATGPFLYGIHRLVYRKPDALFSGESAWLVLGLPWLITALWRSVFDSGISTTAGQRWLLFLWVMLGASCLYAAVVAVIRFRRTAPGTEGQKGKMAPGLLSLIDTIGGTLALLWPFQFLVAMLLEEAP